VGRELLRDSLVTLPRVQTILAHRGYRGLANLAAHRNITLNIKVPPKPVPNLPLSPARKMKGNFTPIAPLHRVEQAWAQRRLGSESLRSATCSGGYSSRLT
jgi:hypothetical protein